MLFRYTMIYGKCPNRLNLLIQAPNRAQADTYARICVNSTNDKENQDFRLEEAEIQDLSYDVIVEDEYIEHDRD